MSERDDQSIDHELSGVAMAAIHEHEQTVSVGETGAALDAVRSRIAGGDLGGAPPSIDLARDRRRRSPMILLGAAAAVIGMLALGLVAVVGSDRTNDVITPITVPSTATPPPTEPATTDVDAAPTTTAEVEVAPPTSQLNPSGFVEQTIPVDAANPPQLIEPRVWQSVPIDPANVERAVSVAVAVDAVIVKQKDVQAVSILGPGPDRRQQLDISEDVGQIVTAAGSVFYGLGDPVFSDDNPVTPAGLRFVAIASSGPNAGQVVATEEIDPVRYLELPADSFGEGTDGIIDRARDIGTTIIEYVDDNGDSLAPVDPEESLTILFPITVPRFDDLDGDGFPDPGQRIVTPSSGRAWTLDIRRDPANGSTFTGPSAPRPTTGDRVIYTERIGAALDDGDFASSEMPVVAVLNPDGSGRWVRLPEDWDVIASDADGTILLRVTETEFEFAFLDEALAAAGFDAPQKAPPNPSPSAPSTSPEPTTTDPGSGLVQPDAVERECVDDGRCTSAALTEDGRIVTLDPRGDALRSYDVDGVELRTEIGIDDDLSGLLPSLVHIGPDDVAYVSTVTPGAVDPSNDLLAIPLVGSDAGSVVMRWTGLDGTGDSTLIPRKTGLTSVPCCGGTGTRPAADAAIYRWVDRSGGIVESTAPSFDLNLGEAGNSLTRIDTAADGTPAFTRFPLPTAHQNPRDFPQLVATDDGGALAYDFVQLQSGFYDVIVDFDPSWSDGRIDNGDVYYRAITDPFDSPVLEPRGTVLVVDDGAFVRRGLDDIASAGWSGTQRIFTENDNAVSMEGFNQFIDAAQPLWASAPDLFALQFVQQLERNEDVQIEYDDSSAPTITVTTSGALDDSIAADRVTIRTSRGDDGLLRFESGNVSFRCQPGRGQQDFAPDLCV